MKLIPKMKITKVLKYMYISSFIFIFSQRNQIHFWDMRGQRVSLSPRHEFQIELPKGTILEVEIIPEMTEEVIKISIIMWVWILLVYFYWD